MIAASALTVAPADNMLEAMDTKTNATKVLVADDDPVTLMFFRAMLEQFGCSVVAVSSGCEALRAAANCEFDLLLLDRRMPDLGGCQLLAALRAQAIQAPAIATSAEINAASTLELTEAGFQAVVLKPLSSEQLLKTIQPFLPHITHLAGTDSQAKPILDDATALAASGDNPDIMYQLRGLFAAELEALPAELSQHLIDENPALLRERLHRLKASCGFCGACDLAGAVARLEITLREAPEQVEAAFADLLQSCRETLRELQHQGMSLRTDT